MCNSWHDENLEGHNAAEKKGEVCSDKTMGFPDVSLKSEREKRNIPLSQVAAETHISLHYLQSLEEGRYENLPGGMYNRAFLRAYCESLQIDREIMKRYEAEVSPPRENISKPRPQYPRQNTFWKSSPIFAWSLMLVISATGLFFSRKYIAAALAPYFSHTAVTNARPKPSSASADRSVVERSASDLMSRMSVRHSDEESVLSTSGESASEDSDSIQLFRLEFEALDQCWISIDNDRGPVVRRLLEPGEAQVFSAAEEFFIIVGNAGGVQLKINGKRTRPLGKDGQVVKMLINEDTLLDFIDQTSG